MAAFNYRELIRQIPARSWRAYIAHHSLPGAEGIDWSWSDAALHLPLQNILEQLNDPERTRIFSELRRVHDLANRRGVLALYNAVPDKDPLIADFETHVSHAERALSALIQNPVCFAKAEAFLLTDVKVGRRGACQYEVVGGFTPRLDAASLKHFEDALAKRFARRSGRHRAFEIDLLTRHLDGGHQLDICVEDDPQRQREFNPANQTEWRDIRPPVDMSVILYPRTGLIDVLVPGGEPARKKVVQVLNTHIVAGNIQPLSASRQPLQLNRLRQGVMPDEHSGLNLRDHGILSVRLSACKVQHEDEPGGQYLIKAAPGAQLPDVFGMFDGHGTKLLFNPEFDIIEAVVSLYFEEKSPSGEHRILHLTLRPDGIVGQRDLEPADSELADTLVDALGLRPPQDIKDPRPEPPP